MGVPSPMPRRLCLRPGAALDPFAEAMLKLDTHSYLLQNVGSFRTQIRGNFDTRPFDLVEQTFLITTVEWGLPLIFQSTSLPTR